MNTEGKRTERADENRIQRTEATRRKKRKYKKRLIKRSQCKIIHKNVRENREKEPNVQHRNHGKVERE